MEQQKRGFLDGGARTTITVTGVQRVEVAVGRLLVLPPGIAAPAPTAEAKDAILVGYASAFRVAPIPLQLPGERLEPKEQLVPQRIPGTQ